MFRYLQFISKYNLYIQSEMFVLIPMGVPILMFGLKCVLDFTQSIGDTVQASSLPSVNYPQNRMTVYLFPGMSNLLAVMNIS